MDDMSTKIEELVLSHITTLLNETSEIVANFESDVPDIKFLSEATHKIKGSSGTIGFMGLYEVSMNLNDFFQDYEKKGGEITADIKLQMQLLHKIALSLKPEMSTMWQKFVTS